MQEYKVLGLMSGTSLDGLDMAYCVLNEEAGAWKFDIVKSTTIEYDDHWCDLLSRCTELTSENLLKAHSSYGNWLGEKARDFIDENELGVELICSHGHTVFHTPDKGLTFQLGDGQNIKEKTGVTTVSDFRKLDVTLGGQGAPLVPIGDRLLFDGYDACINLGGIANISYERTGERIAYDICPVNMVLNRLANEVGIPFDRGGALAQKGEVNSALFLALENLNYYQKSAPKSLGYEWVRDCVFPLIDDKALSVQDRLATFSEHITKQLWQSIDQAKASTVLITGGGALNDFIIGRLNDLPSSVKLTIPSKEVLEFKEALIFALLGVLRVREEVNCLASVTGASRDNIGGIIFK